MNRSKPDRYDCCAATTTHFDDQFVENEISKLRTVGPHVATRRLLDALVDCGVRGLHMLEVGGGTGTITLGLMSHGVKSCTFVEIVPAFLSATATRASKERCAERINFIGADFVAIHAQIDTADIVVMDRVVCCYPHAESLMNAALTRCSRYFGISYPKDSLASRLDTLIKNRRRRRARNPFRTFVHPEKNIRGMVTDAGFEQRFSASSPLWRMAVYERANGS